MELDRLRCVGVPCMGNNLAVKVRYALGSRERKPKARVSVARRNLKEAECRGKEINPAGKVLA